MVPASVKTQPPGQLFPVARYECEKLPVAVSPASVLNVPRMKSSHSSAGITGRELKHLLERLCERAHQDVTRLAAHEEVAVHQLRVRMKKLQALLRLAADGIEEHSFTAMRQHLRAVKTACAASREEAVRDKMIDKLVHRHHLHVKPRPAVPAGAHVPPAPSFLRHQLHALGQLIHQTPIESLCMDQILFQHARCYRRGRRLMREVAETRDDKTLHRWRHRVKDFYFQTLVFIHTAGARRRRRHARRLGTLLGRDHDFAVLAHEPMFRSRLSPWPDIIQERREAIRQRCLGLGHKLFAAHGSRFNEKLRTAA